MDTRVERINYNTWVHVTLLICDQILINYIIYKLLKQTQKSNFINKTNNNKRQIEISG